MEGSAADGVMARKAELFRLIDVAERHDALLPPRGVAVVRELQLGVGAALELHDVDFLRELVGVGRHGAGRGCGSASRRGWR